MPRKLTGAGRAAVRAFSDLDEWLMGYDPFLYSLPHKFAGIYEAGTGTKLTANQKRLLGASSVASDMMYLHLAGELAVAGFEGVLPSAWSQLTIWRYARTLRFYTPHTITAYVVIEALQNWERPTRTYTEYETGFSTRRQLTLS